MVPADNKWFTRLVVAAAIVDALASLDLRYPEVDKKQRADLEAARQTLLAEESGKRRFPKSAADGRARSWCARDSKPYALGVCRYH